MSSRAEHYNTLMLALAGCVLMLAGCSSTQWPLPPAQLSNDAAGTLTMVTPQLASCGAADTEPVQLDPGRPLTVIVHGCNASGGNYAALARVFESQGQQAVCFNYDDRDSIRRSSVQLRETLRRLVGEARMKDITVLAHSQGGLVARRALVRGTRLEDTLQEHPARLRLVTVSTPFGGIRAASHCSTTLAVLSLGLTIPICQAVTGSKWFDIPPSSPLVKRPGELMQAVESHLKIVTYEQGTCRTRDASGRCLKSDAIFSVEEQRQQQVDRLPPTTELVVAAGHVEIVGDATTPPWKLIDVLRSNGILLAGHNEAEFLALVDTLYSLDFSPAASSHP